LGCKLHISPERAGILGDTFFLNFTHYFHPAAGNFALGKPKKNRPNRVVNSPILLPPKRPNSLLLWQLVEK
jgi:hypothetical protein